MDSPRIIPRRRAKLSEPILFEEERVLAKLKRAHVAAGGDEAAFRSAAVAVFREALDRGRAEARKELEKLQAGLPQN